MSVLGGSRRRVRVLCGAALAASSIAGVLLVGTVTAQAAKSGQTITFAALSPTTYGTPVTLSASSTSNLPVSFSRTGGPCTVVGTTVTPIGVGTCKIKASQNGDASFKAADDVGQPLVINQASQTITFAALTPVPFGTPVTLSATASSALPVKLTVTSGPCTVNGTALTTTGVGTCVVKAAQAGNDNYLKADPVTRDLVVTQAGTNLVANPLTRGIGKGAAFSASATLTSTVTHKGISGQSITMTAGGRGPDDPKITLCTATTNAAGLATCVLSDKVAVYVSNLGTYKASYDGSNNYTASNDTVDF